MSILSVANVHFESTGSNRMDYVAATGDIGIFTSGSERIHIDTAGNVGVGNSSPNQRLTVQGATVVLGATTTNQTSAGSFDYFPSSNTTRILSWGSTGVAGGIGFWTGSGGGGTLEYMRIAGTGNVGIRRTDPGYALDVVGTVNAAAVLVNGLPLTASGGGANVVSDTVNATRYVTFANNTTGTFSQANVSTSLTFNPSTGTLSSTIFNSTSDETFKKDIKTIENALELTAELRGVTFKWKDNGYPSIGLIAQEVEKVVPEVVSTEDGKKTLNYDAIIGLLVESIKELKARVEKLENNDR